MNNRFFENRMTQLRIGVIPIVFNMSACSEGILLSNSNFLFTKIPERGQMDSRFRACGKSPTVTVEIAARFFELLAMTRKSTSCHCEERSDEAISAFSTAPFAGMTVWHKN